MSGPGVRPIRLLLIEDSPSDLRLTVETLRQGKLSNHLDVVRDGDSALRFLRREGEHAEAQRPDLILLDLDLPGTDGRSILAQVKDDPGLCDIPVVVLTASQSHQDVLRSYEQRADYFFNKPLDAARLVGLVAEVDRFWLSIVELEHEA